MLLDKCRDIRRLGACSVDMCYVACGRFDAFVELCPKEWDMAAARLIIEEAGGAVSQYDGNELGNMNGRSIVASGTQELRKMLCNELKRPSFDLKELE
eukprot:Trichotokara_eunicae@DN2125_c0_g1_i1.p1